MRTVGSFMPAGAVDAIGCLSVTITYILVVPLLGWMKCKWRVQDGDRGDSLRS